VGSVVCAFALGWPNFDAADKSCGVIVNADR
jgi:hypothetical protein